MQTDFTAIEFRDDYLVYIDQVKLPLKEEYIKTDDYEVIAGSIERLEIRGAPQIGVAAAYALALAFKSYTGSYEDVFEKAYARLYRTRPTAVNLFWALEEMRCYFSGIDKTAIYSKMKSKAEQIHRDDITRCRLIGENGLQIFNKPSVVLTHCNTGRLATGGEGTAFSVILEGHRKGLVKFVHADETRPLFQGSRLTAFELEKAGIPFAVNTDSTAAFLMQQGKIDLVITGADRIAANGDTANKIGTYNLAVLCNYHKIPFYIAAPKSTFDYNCKSGKFINIELRDKKEVNSFNGTEITRADYAVYSPAFDVTPAELITGIITEEGLFKPPYSFKDV